MHPAVPRLSEAGAGLARPRRTRAQNYRVCRLGAHVQPAAESDRRRFRAAATGLWRERPARAQRDRGGGVAAQCLRRD